MRRACKKYGGFYLGSIGGQAANLAKVIYIYIYIYIYICLYVNREKKCLNIYYYI